MIRLSLHAWIGFGMAGVAIVMGLVATWSSVRNTRGPGERAFVVRSVLWAWLVLTALFTAMYFLPVPYNYYLLAPYFIHVPIMTYRMTSKQLLIREMEGGGVGDSDQ
jgi:hypothetical protein